MKNHLIIFTRYPESGKANTRLIPALGAVGAARLHRIITIHAVIKARQLAMRYPVSIEINYEGGNENLMKKWLGPDLHYRPQRGEDLGERMYLAFFDSYAKGYNHIVILGSDVPDVSLDILRSAFNSLEIKDTVFGPAKDGGYYLVGLKEPMRDIFDGIPWGSDEVLQTTLQKAEGLGLSLELLPPLDDVDRPEDSRGREYLFQPASREKLKPRISIIIPTLNEENNIADTLSSAANTPNTEILVADGGSGDMTVEVAESYGAEVIVSAPGRATQQNAAAVKAGGEILLFLHADTVLPEKYDEHIHTALSRHNVVAGAFLLNIDDDALGLRVISRFANWRARRLLMPYGDQGIFVKKDTFRQIGGFPEIPIMEDYELMRRLQRVGRIVLLPYSIDTSPRRWRKLGILKTTIINQLVILGYHFGASPDKLSKLYNREKK